MKNALKLIAGILWIAGTLVVCKYGAVDGDATHAMALLSVWVFAPLVVISLGKEQRRDSR